MITFNQKNKSAFFSISVIALSSLVIILASVFYYLTHTSAEANNKSLRITATLTSQSVMEKVDRNFYERFGDVQAYAFNQLAIATAEQDSIVPGTQEFLNRMTEYYVLYDLMMICNLEGKVLVVNTKDKNKQPINSGILLKKDVSQEDWFNACTSSQGPKEGAWYSDFIVDKEVGRLYGTPGYGMGFAAPIKNSEGNVVGVWYNFASWKEVTEGIRLEAEENLAKDNSEAFIIITKETGEIISSKNENLLGKILPLTNEAMLRQSSLLPIERYSFGISKSKGAYTFAGRKWLTATFIPKESISWMVFLSKSNLIAVVVCLLVITSLAFYIYRFFKKNIVSRIKEIKDLQFRLGEGEMILVNGVSAAQQDEFGEMKKTLAKLAHSIQSKAAFADEISQGNLMATLEHTANDVLGNSLVNMQSQLQLAKQSNNERNWTAEGLAQIAAILRSDTSTEELYSKIIKFFVTYLKANQGGLFLIKEIGKDKMLGLVSAYAYDKRKFLQKEMGIDQGLIGQALMEKQTIYLTGIPKQYIHITSGLGGASPKTLLIVPLKTEDRIFGAVELASFQEIRPHEISFAEKLAESIAASLNSIEQSSKTKVLLEQLQQQTEQMKAQEEEMRQNMEELAATQEEMMRKEQVYVSRLKALEQHSFS